MPMRYPYGVRDEFFALVGGGWSVQSAASAVGVSWDTGSLWWRTSGLVEPSLRQNRAGGLPGSVPAAVPGGVAGGVAGTRARRPLTSEDRAVIAVLLRQGLSYAGIGEAIGRDKSVIWREVARN
ncbi:helix-turn-helix domain-containing protein, partial [Kribbella solani]